MQTVPRLYDRFQPNNYDLTLTLDREARHFSGSVTITGTTLSNQETLMLHAKDLVINTASVDGGSAIKPTALEYDQLELTAPLLAGDHTITLTFEGDITDGMHGLYPCYFDVDGVKKELLATQFESHHAREVFPCIDEPEAKATFDVTLITETGVEVLGNMPVQEQRTDDVMTTQFETTPRMSTYLLAFVVGDLQKQSAHTKSGVEVNIWATKAQPVESLAFPLEVAVGSIDFFDEYFGIPYPLPKADHVALPDFSSGAMENWGLITYREIALLVDKNSSVSTREYVATVIAHETSHQWFGNLVTMKWWNDLWLNESFATIMEYVAVDALYPAWQTWDTFASQETLSALRRDQLAGVQAVKCEVNHPDEISTLFDPSIVYAKGGRLLKMLRGYIGETAFREGLRTYFQEHAYGNTVGSDLWRAFSVASGKDIESFMELWLSQSGFPLVTVTSTNDGYTLSQQRLVIGELPDESIWPIPLFAYDKAMPPLLDTETMTIQAAEVLPLLNVGNEAHFITQYDDTAWKRVIEALRRQQLSAIDRLALLHETSLLARGGKMATATLIPLLSEYADEDKESVWNIVSMILGDLKRFVEDDKTSESHLKSFVARIASPLNSKLGFEQIANEREQDTKLRATIVGLLSYAEDPDVIERSLRLFHDASNLTGLPSELRPILLTNAVKHGTQVDFERLVREHQTTTNAELRDDITAALCAARSETQISYLLDRLTDTTKVKQQDTFRWFIYLLRNRHARDATWRWMTDSWSWIEQTFKGDKSYDDFARYSASVLSTRAWLAEYNRFFEPLATQTVLARAIEIGCTEIESRVEWLERDTAEVQATLAQEMQ